MTLVDDIPAVSREQLEKMNQIHRRELRQIKNMTELQFQAFKRNFSFGHLEGISKPEASELLTSMIALNLKLLNDCPPSDQDQCRESKI